MGKIENVLVIHNNYHDYVIIPISMEISNLTELTFANCVKMYKMIVMIGQLMLM